MSKIVRSLIVLWVAVCCAYSPQQASAQKPLPSTTGTSQNSASNSETPTSDPLDAKLAQELGADEYGMKSYVFVLLKTGAVAIEDKKRSQELFAGHFSNMGRLARDGKLVLAGPFIDGAPKRGMFILNVATLEEAEKLVRTDPAVAAGLFDYELTKLYCSAALMKIVEIHAKIQQKKIE